MVICLELGADLHMAQLMPLPLTVSCFSKIEIGFAFLVLAHLGSPGKRAFALNGCVCSTIMSCYNKYWYTFCSSSTNAKLHSCWARSSVMDFLELLEIVLLVTYPVKFIWFFGLSAACRYVMTTTTTTV